MLVTRAYKTELDLNNQQITACKRHAGAARWAYNWGLQRKQEEYHTTGTSPSAIDLHRERNALKTTEVPWMYEVSKCAPQEALRNLDNAFAHYFRRAQLKKAGKHNGTLGYPTTQDQEARAGQLLAHRSGGASTDCRPVGTTRFLHGNVGGATVTAAGPSGPPDAFRTNLLQWVAVIREAAFVVCHAHHVALVWLRRAEAHDNITSR
jgi:Helix-turn-helix domain